MGPDATEPRQGWGPGGAPSGCGTHDSEPWGTSGGIFLTDEQVRALADEAEAEVSGTRYTRRPEADIERLRPRVVPDVTLTFWQGALACLPLVATVAAVVIMLIRMVK